MTLNVLLPLHSVELCLDTINPSIKGTVLGVILTLMSTVGWETIFRFLCSRFDFSKTVGKGESSFKTKEDSAAVYGFSKTPRTRITDSSRAALLFIVFVFSSYVLMVKLCISLSVIKLLKRRWESIKSNCGHSLAKYALPFWIMIYFILFLLLPYFSYFPPVGLNENQFGVGAPLMMALVK